MKNKLTLYKGRTMFFLFLLCLFLTQSCRKETLLPSKGVNSLTIAEAKSYFENNFQNTVNLKKQMSTNGSSSASISSNPIDGKQPMWDASILKKLSIQTNAVLVPMQKEGLYVHISEDRMVKFGYLNYMMMYKDQQDNIITEWVELKPSKKWIDAKFLREYDGEIFVKDWDGKIKKIYSFGNTEPARVSGALSHKLNKIASINGSKMDTGNGDMLCTVTTTVTIKTEPKVCPCQGHTYEQFVAGFCPCPTPPSKGYTRTIAVEVEYDCALPPDGPDGPTGGTGNNNNGSGSGYSPIGNPGGGGPNPNDYTPLNCNPDPNYTIPTTPPPPGMEYVLPCSSIAIPTEGTPDPPVNAPTPKTAAQLLIDWFNSDPDAQLHLSAAEATFLNDNPTIANELLTHLNSEEREVKEFGKWAVGYLDDNRSLDINTFFAEFFPTGPALIADPNADNWTDPDNEILTDPDQTVYQEYQDNQPWPTVDRKDVIPYEKFVPMRKDANGNQVNCLILAKEQLRKAGYTCSGYLPNSQTFSIYTTQGGVNLNETKKAISYMISSLNQKIPVLIGVDNRSGAPGANKDNSTDHYVVVVGIGTDAVGKYFQFVDSATDNRSTGASWSNRLYYNSSTGKITGKTAIQGYRSLPGMRDYTITQVRKSIKK